MKSPPPQHHLQDCRSPCWAMPHTSITELCFKLPVKCRLTPIGSGLHVERDVGHHRGSLCAHLGRGGFAAPTACRGRKPSREMLLSPPHSSGLPWAWLISSFLLPSLCFSAQVIYRALSPPYAVEDPYSMEAQAQLKITNLRVRLLKRQGCPCLPAGLDPLPSQPPPPLHYAIYDFIVKGSCFCNGHADHCVPVAGFKPVKAAGVFHVVCTCTWQHLLCGKAEF